MNELLINALRELAASSSSARKSKVGRIRELMPEIERAQHAGVCLADIATTLNTLGFEGMNLKCLQNLIYQARKGKTRPNTSEHRHLPQPVIEERKRTAITEGIHAESILEAARKSMQSKLPASSITLDLLRTHKSTKNRKETK